jgi:hypothetical protein
MTQIKSNSLCALKHNLAPVDFGINPCNPCNLWIRFFFLGSDIRSPTSDLCHLLTPVSSCETSPNQVRHSGRAKRSGAKIRNPGLLDPGSPLRFARDDGMRNFVLDQTVCPPISGGADIRHLIVKAAKPRLINPRQRIYLTNFCVTSPNCVISSFCIRSSTSITCW